MNKTSSDVVTLRCCVYEDMFFLRCQKEIQFARLQVLEETSCWPMNYLMKSLQIYH